MSKKKLFLNCKLYFVKFNRIEKPGSKLINAVHKIRLGYHIAQTIKSRLIRLAFKCLRPLCRSVKCAVEPHKYICTTLLKRAELLIVLDKILKTLKPGRKKSANHYRHYKKKNHY